jgi:hypothetical protein
MMGGREREVELCVCVRVGDHTLFYGVLVRFICDLRKREGWSMSR